MRKGRISVAGASILFALGLAAWEVYFFWYAGSFPELAGRVGLFTPDRLGFNMAWLAALYLTTSSSRFPSACPRPAIGSSAWWTVWPRWFRSQSC